MKNHLCIFCQIINQEIPAKILYKTNKLITILDAFPISQGHCLIISKVHFENLKVINKETWQETYEHIQYLTKLLDQKLAPLGYNLLNNVGKIAKQMIFHFHLHLIPKYSQEDGLLTHSKLQKDINLDKLYQLLTS